MRMSASGLASRMARAIDQILRLAPSISPPMDPVVSTAKATSTNGLADAETDGKQKGKAAASSATRRKCRIMVLHPIRRRPRRQRMSGLPGRRGPELRRALGGLEVSLGRARRAPAHIAPPSRYSSGQEFE